MSIPTQTEFLDSLYTNLEGARGHLKQVTKAGNKSQILEATKMVAKWRKLVMQAGGQVDA
jgi:hypothetical protein